MSNSAEWISVNIKMPSEINDALTQVSNILGVVSSTLEITASLLEVLKTFVIDLDNPLKALVDTLLDLVDSILNDLEQTGLYLYADIPKPSENGFGSNLKGGLDAWRDRMTYALLSPDILNRPNFGNNANVESFHLLVSSVDLGSLMASFGFLMALFKQKASPNLNPPKNFQVRAINEAFYLKYFQNGYLNSDLISAEKERLIETTASLADEFLSGGGAVSVGDLDLVLRFDWLTGEEFIVDKFSGAVLSNGGTPDSALLTWKLDQKLIPNTFRIERAETPDGTVKTYNAKSSNGAEVSKGEKVKNEDGDPIIEYETIGTLNVDYGFDKTMSGSAHEIFEYLDTTVQPGKSYWYRVIPTYGSISNIVFPEIDPSSSDIAKKMDQLIKSIINATKGDGIPSEFKGVYIPISDLEMDTVRNIALSTNIKEGGNWWMASNNVGEGWSTIGISNLFDPIMLATKELQNYVLQLKSSTKGVVDQIISFINLLETKLNTINTFIGVIDSIISLLGVFELIDFSCLVISTDGGTPGVLQSISSSLSTAPEVGNDDYVASMNILGGTVSAEAALNAIKLIFGL